MVVQEYIPLNTWRNNNVVITSKRRHFDVITSKWRRCDVITTSLSRDVFAGMVRLKYCLRHGNKANTEKVLYIRIFQNICKYINKNKDNNNNNNNNNDDDDNDNNNNNNDNDALCVNLTHLKNWKIGFQKED